MGVVIRESIKGTIVNYVGSFLGFLTTIFVVTALLSPEDIGLTKVVIEVGTIFGLLATFGTSASIVRFFPYFKNEKTGNNGFFYYMLVLPLIGCIIVTLAYLLLKEPIINFFIEKSEIFVNYYYLIIPLFYFICFFSVFETYSNVNFRIVTPKISREIFIRILLLIVYTLYGYHLIKQNELVSGIVITYFAGLVFNIIYVFKTSVTTIKHDNNLISKPLRRDILRYTLYMIAGILYSSILSRLDLIMISSQMGLGFAGVYTIAYYIATVIEIPSRSITQISQPIAAQSMKSNDFVTANSLYKKVSLHQLMAGGFVFVLIWINIDNIFKIIPNGDTFIQGKWVVLFIGLAKLLEVTLNFGNTLISFSKYYYWTLIFTVIIMAVGIGTNLLLIPILGISGAAVATVISTFFTLSFQQYIIHRKIKGNPFTFETLKLIIILLTLLIINHLLPIFENYWIDLIFRSAIIAIIALVSVYFFKISDDFNKIVKMICHKITKNG